MSLDDLLTVEEVADILRVSPGTVRRWCVTRNLPHMRLGQKIIRIPKEPLVKWLKKEQESRWFVASLRS